MTTSYANRNANNVLNNVENCIVEIQNKWNRKLRIREVCDDLSIFDWWNDNLSTTQLKAMRSFLNEAIKLGYDGYVCFKVGAKYCASGMWAYKAESDNGYSPDGEFIYRSFQSSDNCWDAGLADGSLLSAGEWGAFKTARQLEKALQNA